MSASSSASSSATSSASTEQRIVTAMVELLRVQGYAATGMKQLAAAAGAPIGSLYHHFPGGKSAIAATALRSSGAVYIQLLPLLLDGEDDLGRAVELAYRAAADDMARTGWANLCPVGTVAGEVADVVPELREVAAEVIASWVRQATAYLVARGLTPTAARSLTYAILGSLEGAFILARTERNPEPLLAAGRAMACYVAALLLSDSLARPGSPGVG